MCLSEKFSYILEKGAGLSLPPSFFDLQPVLVSACLLGCPVRYDCKSKPSHYLPISNCKCIPICPEQLGGLSTPRPRQWLEGGDGRAVWRGDAKVVNILGEDVTSFFLDGASRTLEIARHYRANMALLKGRSPSCGCTTIWIGEKKSIGEGVTTALLRQNGIVCIEVN